MSGTDDMIDYFNPRENKIKDPRDKWDEDLIQKIEKLHGEQIIPIESLEGLELVKRPVHLDEIETEIFRFLEVNRTNAYTIEGFMWEIRHPKKPLLCPSIRHSYEPIYPTDRARIVSILKEMVLKGKICGMYDVNKKDYFYFFKS